MPLGLGEPNPNDTNTYELLEELELNQPEDVKKSRVQSTHRVSAGITLRPANICDRDVIVAEGSVREAQRHGATCVFSRPVMVGSVYHVNFEREKLDSAPVLGVCNRCTMLNDESFEVHLALLQEIDRSAISGRQER